MSLPPLTSLVCIPRDRSRDEVIRDLLTFFANSEGIADVLAVGLEQRGIGRLPVEVAEVRIKRCADAELNHVWVGGMLGELWCRVRIYVPDKPLMVERPWFIELSIEEGEMSRTFLDKERDPVYSDFFALACIAFCEHMQAFFASFIWLQFEGVCEHLGWYGQDPLQRYIGGFVRSNPLTYCDTATYEILLQVQDPDFQSRKLISLSAGAKAIYSYGYMPWFSINEIGRNIEWLRRSLTPHLDIQGVFNLLNEIKGYEDYLSIASEKEEEEIFRQLDTMRLLWATAQQRHGVVSVMLPTKGAVRAGIIPIVAEDGYEWCLYNEQQIDDLEAPAWAEPEGLWTHALALRDAAQQFSIEGVVPSVVLIAWPPFSEQARGALNEAGISVITSTQPVPFVAVR